MKRIIKRILIIIGIILLIIIGLIAYAVVKDLKQEEILKKEVVILTSKDLLKDNFNIEIKTTGEYAYVEKTIKKYYKDLSNNVKELNSFMDSDDLVNIITVDNLQSDRNGFIKSRKTLSDAKDKVVGSMNNISKLCDEETIKNLLDKEKVSSYTIDFYNKLMYTKEDLKELKEIKEDIQKTADSFNKFLDKIEEMLNMLDRNNDDWWIKDGQLFFTTNELVDEYNRLYKELTTMAEEDFTTVSNKKSEGSSI